MIKSSTISIATRKRIEFSDITSEVEKVVKKSGVSEGAVNVFAAHTTAGIMLNENEEGLLKDFEDTLFKLVPEGSYAHNKIDDNARAHLCAMLLGSSKLVPVSRGRLQLGTWQKIFLVELDGPRSRSVVVQVIA